MTEIIPAPPNDVVESDLLLQPEKSRVRRSKHRPKRFRRVRKFFGKIKLRSVLLVIASVVAVVLVAATAFTLTTTNRVNTALGNLNRTLTGLQSRPANQLTLTDFDRVSASLNEVADSLSGAQRVAAVARPFSAVSSDVTTWLSVLEAGQSMVRAGQQMMTGLQPTLFLLVSGSDEAAIVSNISSGQRVVELLRLGRGQFASAGNLLTSARSELEGLDRSTLSSSLLLTTETALTYLTELEQINQILMDSPDLLTQALGLGTETSYLVLAQNNDELRPSGGYLSTYGWLTLRNGRITDYSFSPTTATSPNPPNEAAGPVDVPSWWIRYDEPVYAAWDGSWFADFPSTADMAMWYYNEGDNPQSPVNAAISIDVAGFETILKGLGSVSLPAYDVVVTPENFRQVVYDIRAFGEGELPHKRFVAALYRQILSDWQATADPDASGLLLGALLGALQEKHIMLYFSDPRLNDAVDLLGWSGRQDATSGHDYLLVADANLGNKSNRSVIRQFTYDAAVAPDNTVDGHLTINYDYSARVAEADPAVDEEHHGPLDYRNLLQVFVPLGTVLTDHSGFASAPQVIEGSGHTIFVSRVEVPYDSSESFRYNYTVPSAVEDLGTTRRYRLLIQRQPGSMTEAVNVQVRLPSGVSVIGVSPEPAARYTLDQPILEFQLMLNTDQWIEVIYSS